MRKARATKKAVKATVSGIAAEEAQTLAERAVDIAASLDYKRIAKNALRIAVPLIVLKVLHARHKASKQTKWEKVVLPLIQELKAKFKDM